MNLIPSTEAQNNFGSLLDMAQGEPVTISKKGRPVAVMLSWDDYNLLSMLEEKAAQLRLEESLKDYRSGRTTPAEKVHAELKNL